MEHYPLSDLKYVLTDSPVQVRSQHSGSGLVISRKFQRSCFCPVPTPAPSCLMAAGVFLRVSIHHHAIPSRLKLDTTVPHDSMPLTQPPPPRAGVGDIERGRKEEEIHEAQIEIEREMCLPKKGFLSSASGSVNVKTAGELPPV